MAATAMLASGVLAAGGTMYSAFSQASAMKEKANFEYNQAVQNNELAKVYAGDAIDRGEFDAKAIKRKGNQVRGTARANAAASGINIDDGSIADITSEIDQFTSEDVMQARLNASREAFGIRMQAYNQLQSARMGVKAAGKAATATIIGGVLGSTSSLAKSYGDYKDVGNRQTIADYINEQKAAGGGVT